MFRYSVKRRFAFMETTPAGNHGGSPSGNGSIDDAYKKAQAAADNNLIRMLQIQTDKVERDTTIEGVNALASAPGKVRIPN
ncbi:hypothetical protein [Noviherbaspirillum saxi]|uniref:Uncharacterized protein n=1 Tax=Noviherbaspirillum saxi TaxID=2320863 RepID=A0A3A3FLB0_9BURK|nr:hypothetical protein [Noviherbaspirillum saxi]RJF92155.1 hypothetical protein D3871_26290 [Noviherbaspirillum saxi]